MITGILLGSLFPVLPELLARLEVAGIPLPMAVLIWIMIYPMMRGMLPTLKPSVLR